MTLPAAPWTAQQTYQFDGFLDDPDEPIQHLGFTVLAGATGPTPTGGGADITTIARSRRLGFTMPTGFNPQSMDVPITFENLTRYRNWPPVGARNGKPWVQTVEDQIQVLEWMWGFGKLYANGTHPARGNPPTVQVTSFTSEGQPSNLIPPNWRSNTATGLRWMVTNLSYANGAYLDEVGNRVQADITVSLIQYVGVPGAPVSPRQRQKDRGAESYVAVTSTRAADTILKLCQNRGLREAWQWATVVNFNIANGGKIRSYTQKLKVGTRVMIPTSLQPAGASKQQKRG